MALSTICVGKWALCWHQMRRLCPQLFAHVDVAASPLPALRELRSAHKRLQDKWRRMDGIYREIDSSIYDYDKFGEAHCAYRPPYLPGQHKLEPIMALATSSKFHFGAQREYSLVVHHAAWFDLLLRLRQSAPAYGCDTAIKRAASRRGADWRRRSSKSNHAAW